MGNRKTKPLDGGMRVDSTADLQENAGDLMAGPAGLRADGDGSGSGEGKSKAEKGTLYKAVNLDENGKFIQYGLLEVTANEIVFHRLPELPETPKAGKKKDKKSATLPTPCSDGAAHLQGRMTALGRAEANGLANLPPIRWPFHLLRRYGYDQDLFTIETGRRACTGAGIYAFHTDNAAELFRDLQDAIRQSSANLRKKRDVSGRAARRLSSTDRTADGKSAFNENSAGDFMHWSPVLVAHDSQQAQSQSLSINANAAVCSGNTKEKSCSPLDAPASVAAVASASASTSAAAAASHYMEPPKQQQQQSEHNYVNLADKSASRTRADANDAAAAADDTHEYKLLCGEPRAAALRQRAADADAQRLYENLSRADDSRDSYYVNIPQLPRSSGAQTLTQTQTQARDANGHLPGCPCHRKSVSRKGKKDSTAAAAQLNYVELDLRNCLKQPGELLADSEDNATSLSELTTQTRLTVLTNASAGTGSSSPSGTSSSVFSANSKLAQASNSFLALSESRQPLLGSGSIGSTSGLCATLALAKAGNQSSRPNSDSLAQTHVCTVHKHVMKCKEHPLAKHCGSQRMIQYTQIDFERTTALSNSKKSLEAPRSSVSKEVTSGSGKKNSVDTLNRKERGGNEEALSKQQQQQQAVVRASPPKTVANTLVTDLLKRSRHNSNN